MRALVTGAEGFVGGHLLRHLVDHGDEVLAGILNSRATALPQGVQAIELDITRSEACQSAISTARPDVVYHLAGLAFVPEAEEDFEKALRVNVAGVHYLTRALLKSGSPSRLVHISSAEVYGKMTPEQLPVRETVPVQPANAYSLSKRMGELVVEKFARSAEGAALIMRPFNHIGPGQNERFVTATFAAQLARIAKGLAPALLRVGNLEARRDFSDVRDIVRAYRLASIRGEGIYNLGSGVGVPIQEILDALIDIAGMRGRINVEQDPARMRPAEVPEVYTSYARAQIDLGWEPRISLQQSLEDIYRDWYDRV